jgi:hypothetical protein
MSPTVLPNELLLTLAEVLDNERDINSLSQINRCLYELLNPFQY